MAINIARQIHKLLIKNELTVAVAESCTGGLVSSYLTQNSGSSRYFLLGATVYSNQAKIDILGIPETLIARKGAVCAEVALNMAKRIRKIASSDFGVGITGIAGPGGATQGKPVGTVFIAVASKDKSIYKRFQFSGNRTAIRKRSVMGALKLLAKTMRQTLK
ncbi:MAG: CinA family protein [Candidatus Omnitrophica bacterium]|nr:CinA family protein [Candidatus Omnitrophota bacterium]